MPGLSLPPAPHRPAPPPTTEALDYAELPIIDISQAADPERRAQLALEVHDAMRTHGFFYVVGHGYTPEQTARMFDIADIPFSAVSPEEKEVYVGKMKQTGSYHTVEIRVSFWMRHALNCDTPATICAEFSFPPASLEPVFSRLTSNAAA
ncbi:Clavaminate synthase-like protein [Mycena chlorophos]|uniref:Clavaminate synthase-like protein n=1 Tax=Mycena chlorophos TaxID=658473 RepID=A0A8H6STT2_MYCCL|nr:Clavaminate synthase-like protein [Mycena chlorophos]